MKKRYHRLSDMEMDVLQVLNEHGSATAQQVRRCMPRGKELSYSTVITVLQRMEAKGYVSHTKANSGKAFVFHPKLKPDQVRRSIVGSMVERYFHDNPIPAFHALVETRGLSREEIEEMRRALDEMDAPDKSERGRK